MRLLTLLIALAVNTYALDEAQILDLIKKEHSRDGLSKAMQIFPDVTTFKVTYDIHFPKNAPKQVNGLIVKDKFVEGKYLVSQFTIGDKEHKFDLVNVTYYSAAEQCYYRWALNKQLKSIYEYRGVRVGKSNVVGWSMVNPEKNGYNASLFTEIYETDKVTWSQRDYRKGKLSFSMSGVAKKDTK